MSMLPRAMYPACGRNNAATVLDFIPFLVGSLQILLQIVLSSRFYYLRALPLGTALQVLKHIICSQRNTLSPPSLELLDHD